MTLIENKKQNSRVNLTTSIITLNVNRLHNPIKSRDYMNRFKKHDPAYVLYRKQTLDLKIKKIAIKNMEKDLPCHAKKQL